MRSSSFYAQYVNLIIGSALLLGSLMGCQAKRAEDEATHLIKRCEENINECSIASEKLCEMGKVGEEALLRAVPEPLKAKDELRSLMLQHSICNRAGDPEIRV